MMGGAASTPEAFFAFQVVQLEYELLCRSDDISEKALKLHLESLFVTAQREFGLESPLECSEPACILMKLKRFESEEEAKKFCKQSVIDALAARERSKPKLVDSDYSKGFSGSAADTKAEKDFEKMMRDGGEEDEDAFPILKPPRILYSEQRDALEQAGSWCRELTTSGCYMYCHSLTRNIVSHRPEDYQDDDEAELHTQEGGDVEKDPANGLMSCLINDLPKVLEDLEKNGEERTPLLLDATEGSQCLTFYSMKANLEDVSNLVVPYSISGVKRSDVVEKCRRRLVGAIKSGSSFVLYLGGVHIEHANFKAKLCKKDTFPVEVFQQRGAKLLAPKTKPRYKLILREEDMEEGLGDVIARDGFQVLVVSTLSPYEYEERLQDCIPLGYMLPIYIHN